MKPTFYKPKDRLISAVQVVALLVALPFAVAYHMVAEAVGGVCKVLRDLRYAFDGGLIYTVTEMHQECVESASRRRARRARRRKTNDEF